MEYFTYGDSYHLQVYYFSLVARETGKAVSNCTIEQFWPSFLREEQYAGNFSTRKPQDIPQQIAATGWFLKNYFGY